LLTEFIKLVTSFRRHMSTSSGKLANKIIKTFTNKMQVFLNDFI